MCSSIAVISTSVWFPVSSTTRALNSWKRDVSWGSSASSFCCSWRATAAWSRRGGGRRGAGAPTITTGARPAAAGGGEEAGGRGLDDHTGVEHVGQGGAPVLQHEPRVAGGDVGRRLLHAGAAARAPAHGDEALGLQDAERLAQRRPGDGELRHEG